MRTKLAATLLLTLILAACGGGDDGNSNDPAPPPPDQGSSGPVVPDSVATKSGAVATQLGAKAVQGNTATAQAFDLVADIGDTWRLVLNQNGTFTIKVLATQYSLADTSGTYTQQANGDFVTFTASGFKLQLDTRTRTIAGTVTLGGKSSAVAGSGYAMPADTSTLAGDYFFFGGIHNVSNGGSPELLGGTFRLATNGTDVTLCDGGLINAKGTCDAIPGGGSSELVALTLVKNGTDGLTHMKLGAVDFGIVSVQAGDRGPVLVLDRFGLSDDTPPVMRTGALYATKQQHLAGNEANGKWECVSYGTTIGTITADGTAVQTKETDGTSSVETFHYNTVNGGTDDSLTAVDGVITSVVKDETAAEGTLFLPLSSSLAVAEAASAQSAAVCHVAN